jgi:signal peptidase II
VKKIGLILAILFFDILSKWYVHAHMPSFGLGSTFFPYGGVSVFENVFGIDFCIHHVTNRGAAWGFFANWHHLLLILRLCTVTALVTYLFASPKAEQSRFSLSLIIAGGLGNVLDNLFYGHVVDMFHFFFWGYSYPVFNIADAAIFCGIAGLVIGSFRRRAHATS